MLSAEDVRRELERAGMPFSALNGNRPPGLQSICPCCGAGGVMEWREGDDGWTCANGCEPSAIADAVAAAASKTWGERSGQDAIAYNDARRELEALWALDMVGLTISHARIVGRGSRASADVYFDDGSEITFESLKDAARPSTLLPELAASVGALPGLKQTAALRGVTLLRRIARHQVTFSEDEIARDWGTSYLQSTNVIDVDMADQRQRWAAFERLNGHHVGVVLRDLDGTRYVRCGWFREVVRFQDGSISPQELAHRMERIGWRRRGATGRVKATAPGRQATLAWSFYLVPEDWEDDE